MDELTPFQIKCEKELRNRLRFLRVDLSDRKEWISEETWFADESIYIEATIKNLAIWIYEDEASVSSGKNYFHFERPDFNTEDDLLHAFCDKVISLLQNMRSNDDISDGSAKRIELFRFNSKRREKKP
ncbi:MAG: hypothetical protein HY208_02915 [Nitrospirae bacterium]|nr:hypothetical protein [Nitrospirota bacterium]